MAEFSSIESSAMASNIDIAVATTSPSSEPSQAASTEASTKHIPKRQFRKTEQKRRPITDGERKLLRDYFFKEKGGKITHKDVIKWYAETHYCTLNQSTVSIRRAAG
ncbi:MAG: hypothetical protein ALECFALPRED_001604 [Alectoria fallacina]|uniref:ARS-binding protein 1 N-terminal domain-containing protein n=1 Tax=Alectoria fallacina TaxID=1903189 RepID=A0A8H3IA90_9LECA|nr:MAG: hypothetical protein ALECFALPRED_001604 [Alectoria fallacina]